MFSLNIFKVFRKKPKKLLPSILFMVISYDGISIKGKNMSFTFDKPGQTAQLSVVATDVEGTVRPVEDISYSSSDPTIVLVDQAGLLTALTAGTVVITVNADAMIGPGTSAIVGTLDVTVLIPVPLATKLELSATLIV